MKIAQIAPLFESVPPKNYGGTERVVSYLTEALVNQGHDVTLFASGDSQTSATLVSPIAKSERAQARRPSWLSAHSVAMDMVAERAAEFDILHFHTDYLHFPLARQLTRQHGVAHLTTLHGRLDLSELPALFSHFDDTPLVSISNHQRMPVSDANWVDTIYHGLPADLYDAGTDAASYFVFLGRFSPEKRVDRAIDIAQRCRKPIYIGAKIEPAEQDYFDTVVAPLLKLPDVHYLGEIGELEKQRLLAHADALLCPIDWPEPFGLVMIEALACGAPVITYRNGAAPEIIEHGVTGFIVDNQEDAVAAAQQLHSISRTSCRQAFESRFTADLMARQYVRLYTQLQELAVLAQPFARHKVTSLSSMGGMRHG